jgi:hypothetical protein
VVHRGGVESRLRPRAAGITRGSDVRITEDGRSAVDLPVTDLSTLPLRACLVPRPTLDADRVTLRRLPALEAMLLLLRSPRLVGWRDQATTAQQFSLVGDLVERVPVVVADIPWGPPFDPSVPRQVVDALDALN